jgi:carbon storage regulator
MSMLVLSRKPGQRIVVPQCQLAVTVLAVEGSHVRLGFRAPNEIAVHREEVWHEIRQQFDGGSPETPEQSDFETLAAELADAAYSIAMRARAENSWINLELSLWKALAKTVKLWATELPRAGSPPKTDSADGRDTHVQQLDERFSLAAAAALES